MADPRVFISYDWADQQFAHQLAIDLKARGVPVMDDGNTMPPERAKNALLSQAQWLLLVRSSEAEPSKRVQDEVDIAMDRTISQHMQGVLAVSPRPSSQAGPPAWSVIRSFTATDYANPISHPEYERALNSLLRIISEGQQAQPFVQASSVGALPAPVQPVPRPATVGNGVRKLGVRSGIVVGIALIVVLLTATVFSISLNKNSNPVTPASPVATRISNGTSAVTVTHTATPGPSPAVTPTVMTDAAAQHFYDQWQGETPSLSDPMNNTSGNKWDNNGTSCVFAPHYHVTTNSGFYAPCMLQGASYTNFVYQVAMRLDEHDQGAAGGLIFRAAQTDQSMRTFYRFSLSTQGDLVLRVCTIDTCQGNYATGEGSEIPLQPASVTYQSGVANTITVIALGTDFYLFVNQKFVVHVADTHIPVAAGGIGLYAALTGITSPTTMAAFSDMKVWKL